MIVLYGRGCMSSAQFQLGIIFSFSYVLKNSGSIGAAQKLNHGDSDIAIKYVLIVRCLTNG
jgi:hypothetical protein